MSSTILSWDCRKSKHCRKIVIRSFVNLGCGSDFHNRLQWELRPFSTLCWSLKSLALVSTQKKRAQKRWKSGKDETKRKNGWSIRSNNRASAFTQRNYVTYTARNPHSPWMHYDEGLNPFSPSVTVCTVHHPWFPIWRSNSNFSWFLRNVRQLS